MENLEWNNCSMQNKLCTSVYYAAHLILRQRWVFTLCLWHPSHEWIPFLWAAMVVSLNLYLPLWFPGWFPAAFASAISRTFFLELQILSMGVEWGLFFHWTEDGQWHYWRSKEVRQPVQEVLRLQFMQQLQQTMLKLLRWSCLPQ